MQISERVIADFKAQVWSHYEGAGRGHLPWRLTSDPYKIMVSEIMLQQTQVDRVVTKYQEFIMQFPASKTLAAASLGDVLRMWQGLGYNRRAKFLYEAAKMIEDEYEGVFPREVSELTALPGVGINTAGAIVAYAFNAPVVYIETNVRTVLLHHFFDGEERVSDARLREVAGLVVDTDRPREWYWALMDYGSHLKRLGKGGLSRATAHRKQSPLKGSIRETRGAILRRLSVSNASLRDLEVAIEQDERFEPALEALMREGLVQERDGHFGLTA